MKIIITKKQYKKLVYSLLDTIVGELTVQKRRGNNYTSVYDSEGENIMNIFSKKGSGRNKGCKSDLGLDNEFLIELQKYVPYFKNKIFSEALVDYVYEKTGIKCDCVDYSTDYKVIDNNGTEFGYFDSRFAYNVKKKKKIRFDESVENSNLVERLLALENIKIDFDYIDGRVLNDYEIEKYFGTDVIDDNEIEDTLSGGDKIYIREVYVHFYDNNNELIINYHTSPSIDFITKNNKVIGINMYSRFTNVATSFNYIPHKMLDSYFIENAKTYLEKVLSNDNKLNESVENRQSLDEIIYDFLEDDYYPDYNWGPELFDFYKNDVKNHGSVSFYINDSEGYTYYDHGTLEIMPFVSERLDEWFNDSWLHIFTKWFEEHSGLKVKRVVTIAGVTKINESTDKNKKLLKDIIGFDFSNRIKQINSSYDIPMEFDDCIGGGMINRYLNFWGPMYLFSLRGSKILYQDRGDFEWFMYDDCIEYVDNEIPEKLGISIMGLRFSDIINMYFEEEEE